ncbi:hypothetical protein LMG27177_07179 [Paraburkholderia fynbosensis]|uniref:Uncharacterized protein n=1 Tax=Paraburkholderia fynbosensis TaxID=1200993 RepID=A0A6J5H441_9BURK|nr:hypothetical protein LMG27177_07179 [Paraburkholderia fynbosensis]
MNFGRIYSWFPSGDLLGHDEAPTKHRRNIEETGYQPSRNDPNYPNYPNDIQNAQKKAGIGAAASQ